MEELYDQKLGTKCLLIRYDSEETGVLRAEGGTQDILFHLNQLCWVGQARMDNFDCFLSLLLMIVLLKMRSARTLLL